MTLEEAIIHCKEKACGNTQCALEHRQLAEWLKELQSLRSYKNNSIEERADRVIYEPTDGHPLKACEVVAFARGYELGTTEQKAIDEKEIKQLYSIMEQSASVLGIGTKWYIEEARQIEVAKLKEMILNYLKEY